ncbi:transposase [Streptosporangium subroseum]|nr:transposase [Streptosporangium subroseum]
MAVPLFPEAVVERGLGYVVQVKGAVTAHQVQATPETIPYRGMGRPSTPQRYRTKAVSLREHVLAAGRTAAVTLTWRAGWPAAYPIWSPTARCPSAS